ncbi:MAG: hypothetical protein OEU98_01190 [Actinomycetota bacterium]|nr:hypothetical protein [Actinomycetota bacterium]
MAKSGRERPLPSTPGSRPQKPVQPPVPGTEPGTEPGTGKTNQVPARPARSKDESAPPHDEPEHVITGTDCLSGHQPGETFTTGGLGKLPSRKKARVGFTVVLWCLVGFTIIHYAGVTEGNWTFFAVQLALLWLAFAAFLVRRAGHRKRCWRTRSWRHAWGGLAPGSGADPTRPAGT